MLVVVGQIITNVTRLECVPTDTASTLTEVSSAFAMSASPWQRAAKSVSVSFVASTQPCSLSYGETVKCIPFCYHRQRSRAALL